MAQEKAHTVTGLAYKWTFEMINNCLKTNKEFIEKYNLRNLEKTTNIYFSKIHSILENNKEVIQKHLMNKDFELTPIMTILNSTC